MNEIDGFVREHAPGAKNQNVGAEPGFLDREIDPRAMARICVWMLALLTTAVGIFLSVWRLEIIDAYGETQLELAHTPWLGPGLLCVGLLILAAVLIAEAYRPRTGSPEHG